VDDDDFKYGYVGDLKYTDNKRFIVFQKDKKTNEFIKNLFPNWEYIKITKEEYNVLRQTDKRYESNID
jgi:hypothetical protein